MKKSSKAIMALLGASALIWTAGLYGIKTQEPVDITGAYVDSATIEGEIKVVEDISNIVKEEPKNETTSNAYDDLKELIALREGWTNIDSENVDSENIVDGDQESSNSDEIDVENDNNDQQNNEIDNEDNQVNCDTDNQQNVDETQESEDVEVNEEDRIDDTVTLPSENDDEKSEEDIIEVVEDVKPVITADNMLITKDTNTKDDVYVSGVISYNNYGEFRLTEETNDAILKAIKSTGKHVSFYITDPQTNASISYNADYQMQPASSIKAGMALFACKMADTGQISLDDEMEYTQKYKHGGSGTIQYDKFGTKYTIRELVNRCIHVSDNIAYLMLTDIVGKDNYNNLVTELGCDNTMASWQQFGLTSSHDLNLIWQEIYNSDREKGEELYRLKKEGVKVDESEYSACAILNYELLDAKYNFLANTITKYPSSHKSGFSGGSYNDSGVVYTPQGELIVTVMTNGDASNNAYKFNLVVGALNGAIEEICANKENTTQLSNINDVEMGE